MANDSPRSKPAVKSSVLVEFTVRPDQEAKSSKHSEISCRLLLEPSKNTITSSANMRWEILTFSVLGWYPISPISYLAARSLDRPSIARMKRYGDRGSPWRIPLVLLKNPPKAPLMEMENEAVERHSEISLMKLSGIARARRDAMMKSHLMQSNAFLRSTLNIPRTEMH